MTGRRLARAATAALMAAVSVLSLAGTAHAASVGGLGVRPTHFDPTDPETRAFFKHQVAPGESFTDSVTVTNSSDAPLSVIVSAVDGLTAQTSGAVYANRTDPVAESGRWVHATSSTLTVPAHQDVEVPFTVDVPADATTGDHLAGLAFEDASPSTSGGTFSITQIVRAVVGVEVHVGHGTAFAVTPGTPQLKELPGTKNAAVDIPLTSSGQLLGKPTVDVTLTSGSYHRTVSRSLDTILPGDSIEYPFVWPDDLVAGDYSIKVDVRSGATTSSSSGRSTIGATLAGAANGGADKHVTVVSTPGGGSPMAPTIVIVLAAMVAALLADRVRRSARGRAA